LRFHLFDDGSAHSKAFTYTGKRGNILTPRVGYESAIQENFMSLSVVEDDVRRNSNKRSVQSIGNFRICIASWLSKKPLSCKWLHASSERFSWSQCIPLVHTFHHDMWKQAFRSRAALTSATDSGRPVDCNKLRQYATNGCNTTVYRTACSRLKWLFMDFVFLGNNSDLINLMFVDPCIIAQFIQKKAQQDARVYQNVLFHIYMKPDSVQQPHVQQPSTYAKPEAASAVLGSWWWAVCHPKHVELHINME